MNTPVLVVGSGGREHALAWKLSRSRRVSRVIVAPGNDGMPFERWPVDLSLGHEEFVRLAKMAKEQNVGLTVVGPDQPLADGIVDVFEAHGLKIFGPRAEAARLESSKSFAKEVMGSAGVPTARAFVAENQVEARKILRELDWSKGGWVLKVDGLALGKGVRVCDKLEEAISALDAGLGGTEIRYVIEERLFGVELSWMAFCDGDQCALLDPARDHKRIFDGDLGPNTGGMGAFSPVPGVPPHWAERVRKEVFLPTLSEMNLRGTPFRGLLYAGLMADFSQDRFWVLEFNARFGDPETQALLPRMEDDLYLWCNAVAHHDLSSLPEEVRFHSDTVIAVVAAAGGYPDQVQKGAVISKIGFEAPEVFFGHVARRSGSLYVSGGRVLAQIGRGAHLAQARERAYAQLRKVRFEGMQYRSDIGGTA